MSTMDTSLRCFKGGGLVRDGSEDLTGVLPRKYDNTEERRGESSTERVTGDSGGDITGRLLDLQVI